MAAFAHKKGYVIGIDLGTTYSCVGIWKDGRAEILANNKGNRTTPSFVSFDRNERFVGEAAKIMASSNPQNTVFDIKRFTGRDFSDPIVQADLQLWPFKVTPDAQGRPRVEVQYKDQAKYFATEEISASILAHMKQIAEAHVGEEIRDAVITVPAYFNDRQRQATKAAATIAGLNCLRMINEPTAAAIAYGLDKKAADQTVLVFDLGGGTLDVSIVSISGGIIEVTATNGDTHLGGEDFDNRLVDFFVKEFKTKYKLDMSKDPRALRRLRTACESAKRSLSSSSVANLEIDSLYQGVDFRTTITRARFEELNLDLFKKCLEPVSNVLRDSKVQKEQVNEVLLIGGSSRIPKVQEMLSALFEGKALNRSMNPDEAVACGATLQAAVLSGDSESQMLDLVLVDVTPLSLGIETQGGLMSTVVNRNTSIPITRKKVFTTCNDNQTTVSIEVFEGERSLTSDCNLLGKFLLENIPPKPKGEVSLDVTFSIDADGVLEVSACERSTGKDEKIIIKNDDGHLTGKEIGRMIEEAEQFAAEDNANRVRVEAKNALRELLYKIYKVQRVMRDDKKVLKLSAPVKSKINELASATNLWLEKNPDASKEELDSKVGDMEAAAMPIAQFF